MPAPGELGKLREMALAANSGDKSEDDGLWPEKRERVALIEEIEAWLKENENSASKHPPPAKWVAKAKSLLFQDRNLRDNADVRLLITVNPAGGHGNGPKFIKTGAIPILRALGFRKFDYRESEYSGHQIELIAGIDLNNYDAVVACGGDGTFGMTYQGLAKNKTFRDGYYGSIEFPMGAIPTGSGGYLASQLSEKLVPLESPNFLDVIDNTLHVASMTTTPVKTLEIELVSHEGKISREVTCVGTLMGETSLMFVAADELRARNPELQMLRYFLCSNITQMMHTSFPFQVSYLPYDSDEDAADLSAEQWVTDAWTVVPTGIEVTFGMVGHIFDDPRDSKKTMHHDDVGFTLMFSRPGTRAELAQLWAMSIDFRNWNKPELKPDNLHPQQVKAMQLEWKGGADHHWKALLNNDGEIRKNAKRLRAWQCPMHANILNNYPARLPSDSKPPKKWFM